MNAEILTVLFRNPGLQRCMRDDAGRRMRPCAVVDECIAILERGFSDTMETQRIDDAERERIVAFCSDVRGRDVGLAERVRKAVSR